MNQDRKLARLTSKNQWFFLGFDKSNFVSLREFRNYFFVNKKELAMLRSPLKSSWDII